MGRVQVQGNAPTPFLYWYSLFWEGFRRSCSWTFPMEESSYHFSHYSPSLPQIGVPEFLWKAQEGIGSSTPSLIRKCFIVGPAPAPYHSSPILGKAQEKMLLVSSQSWNNQVLILAGKAFLQVTK